jgi:hypothetical protein
MGIFFMKMVNVPFESTCMVVRFIDVRGEVWSMVTEISAMAEALREQIEQGAVTECTALLVGS